jgi:hypothetical protein
MIANEFIRLPYLYSRMIAPQVPRWGIEHKRFVRKNYKRSAGVMGTVREMPVFENRVKLAPYPPGNQPPDAVSVAANTRPELAVWAPTPRCPW